MSTRILVTGHYENPDGSFPSGQVSFRLPASMRDPSGSVIVAPNTVTTSINPVNGNIYPVYLYATDDPAVSPYRMAYEITETIIADPISGVGVVEDTWYAVIPYAAAGGAIDLKQLIAGPPSLGSYAFVTTAQLDAAIQDAIGGGIGGELWRADFAPAFSALAIPNTQTTFTDVPGLTSGVRSYTGSYVDLEAQILCQINAGGGSGRIDFQVIDENGNTHEMMRWQQPIATTVLVTLSGAVPVAPTSGSHTFRLQCRMAGGAAGVLYGNPSYTGYFRAKVQ